MKKTLSLLVGAGFAASLLVGASAFNNVDFSKASGLEGVSYLAYDKDMDEFISQTATSYEEISTDIPDTLNLTNSQTYVISGDVTIGAISAAAGQGKEYNFIIKDNASLTITNNVAVGITSFSEASPEVHFYGQSQEDEQGKLIFLGGGDQDHAISPIGIPNGDSNYTIESLDVSLSLNPKNDSDANRGIHAKNVGLYGCSFDVDFNTGSTIYSIFSASDAVEFISSRVTHPEVPTSPFTVTTLFDCVSGDITFNHSFIDFNRTSKIAYSNTVTILDSYISMDAHNDVSSQGIRTGSLNVDQSTLILKTGEIAINVTGNGVIQNSEIFADTLDDNYSVTFTGNLNLGYSKFKAINRDGSFGIRIYGMININYSSLQGFGNTDAFYIGDPSTHMTGSDVIYLVDTEHEGSPLPSDYNWFIPANLSTNYKHGIFEKTPRTLKGWGWSSDNSEAYAIMHTDILNHPVPDMDYNDTIVTSHMKTPATCEVNGITTYEASFEIFDLEQGELVRYETSKDVANIPATGHNYVFDHFEWASDYSSASAVFICTHDNSHIDRKEGTVTKTVITEATKSSEGLVSYTVTYLDNTQTIEIVTPKLASSGLPGWAVALIVVGSVLVALGGAYALLFFVFNSYVDIEGKKVRVFVLPYFKKGDESIAITMTCRIVYRKKVDFTKLK